MAQSAEIEAILVDWTADAWLFEVADEDEGMRRVWLPKSKVDVSPEHRKRDHTIPDLEVPTWLLDREGITY